MSKKPTKVYVRPSQLFVPMNLDTYEPTFNFGRETNFNAPLLSLPPEMATGYNESKAPPISVITAKVYCEVMNITIDEFKKQVAEQRQKFYEALLDEDSAVRKIGLGNPKESLTYNRYVGEFTKEDDLEDAHKVDTLTIPVLAEHYKQVMLDQPIRINEIYVVISGQRRSSSFWLADLYRSHVLRQLSDDYKSELRYPCLESPHKTLSAIQDQQIEDNDSAMQVGYDKLGKIVQAVKFLNEDVNIKQTTLAERLNLYKVDAKTGRKKLNVRQKQDIYWIAQLVRLGDQLGLNLLERFKMPANITDGIVQYKKGGHVPYGRMKFEHLGWLLKYRKENDKQTDSVELIVEKCFNGKYVADGKPPTVNQIETYFKILCDGLSATKQAITYKTLWETYIKQCQLRDTVRTYLCVDDLIDAMASGDSVKLTQVLAPANTYRIVEGQSIAIENEIEPVTA